MDNDYYQESGMDNNNTDSDSPLSPGHNRESAKFATIALTVSLLSYALCCCHPYIMITCCILSIGLAIISKVIIEPDKRMHSKAIAAIIISVIGLLLIIGSFVLVYTTLPDLLQDPEIWDSFLDTLRQMGIDPGELGYSVN